MDHKNQKGKFTSIVDKKLMPLFSKLSTQKHLVTIRDAFGIVTPLIIAGAIALIGAIFIFGGSGGEKTSILGWIAKASGGISVGDANNPADTSWSFTGNWAKASKVGSNIFGTITDATIGIFSIFIAFEIAYIHTRANKSRTDAVIAGLTSVAAFALVCHGFSGAHRSLFIGAGGLLVAIITAFFTSWIFDWISASEKLKIKLPKEVPPAISLGFSYIIPILLTLIVVGALDSISLLIGLEAKIDITKQVKDSSGQISSEVLLAHGNYGFAGLFYRGIGAPFQSFTSSSEGGLGIAVFYSFFVAFFWWFGINGSSVMNGIFSPILTLLVIKNAELVSNSSYAAVESELSTVSITFLENYTQLTGWGMTGGLIIGTFILSKIKSRKEISKLATMPALFNVNEPMTFGYPIMLNPIYAIPSMVIMPLNTVLAFLVVDTFGWVNKTYLMVPWTVPPGVGALLATGFDWKAMILAWFCLAVAIVIYIPFILIDNILNKDLISPLDHKATKHKWFASRKKIKKN